MIMNIPKLTVMPAMHIPAPQPIGGGGGAAMPAGAIGPIGPGNAPGEPGATPGPLEAGGAAGPLAPVPPTPTLAEGGAVTACVAGAVEQPTPLIQPANSPKR